jgi:serpin B
MGMKDSFSDNANFSGITGSNDLKISKVIHKAYLEVNEEGTEAAAATAVIMVAKCMAHFRPVPPPTFRADHPFIFAIIHRKTHTLLFLGNFLKPTPVNPSGRY